ncbi:TPA: ABC-2 transporter permease [Thermoplasmata archaeon]|nr:ABC-2 transporter permease [Thermoplasmata archaeon]
MNLRRTLEVARKTLRSLKHDRRTAGFLVLMPLFMIAIFGYTFGGDLRDVEVMVVNMDSGGANGSVAEMIVSEMSQGDTLRLTFVSADRGLPTAAAEDAVRDADAWAALVFDVNFTLEVEAAVEAMRAGLPLMPCRVDLLIDGSNPNIAQAVIAEVAGAIQKVLVTQYGLVPPVAISQDMIYGQDAEFIDFFAPGVMGLAGMMVTLMLSIISFVHERTNGTLDRLLTTPVTEGEIVGGYALAFGLVALIQSTVILLAAVILFRIEIVGNPLLLLLVIFLLGIGSQGLGFILSSNAKNEFQAVQFMPLILFPSILLAGVFWPLEAVPSLLRPVSYFIPLTYAVDACRSIMIRGWGVAEVWPQLLILAVIAVVLLILSAYSLKKRG